MPRNLSLKRVRFISSIENYSSLYRYTNKREQILISNGALNLIWNSWNNFWRDYWIAHVSGGYYFDNKPLTEIFHNYSDKQCCDYLLFAAGKRKRHTIGQGLSGVYQEATWGDPKVILNIANTLNSYHPHMSYILGVLGIYKTEVEHFQQIRNSFIHLNNENIYYLNSIAGHYRFDSNQGLIDILNAKPLSRPISCFSYLTDNLTGMIKSL